MGLCSTRRVAALLIFIWIVTMAWIWFPQFFSPLISSKRIQINKGIYRSDMADYRSNLSQTNAIHVCIASDESRLGGMMTLINSIHRNTKHNVVFHLIVDEESVDHARAWIETTKLSDITYDLIKFPEELVHGKIKIRGGRSDLASPLNYARYYLPTLLPMVHGKVLYIDDDCIVQGDIHEMNKIALEKDHAAAFSSDCVGTSRRVTLMKNYYADYIDFKNPHVKKMKLNPTECAFNTGVFVANLDLWRKHNITNQLEYWLQLNTKEEVYGNERGGGGSQPPMMIVFYDKYTPLDPNWHVRYLGWTPGTSYSKQFLQHAKLLHWNGRFKPWGPRSQHSDIWQRYFIPDPMKKFVLVRKN